MKTFFNILQTIVNIRDKVSMDNPFIFKETNMDEYSEIKINIKYLVTSILNESNKCKTNDIPYYLNNASAKLTSLNKIIENNFYKKELKEEIINSFSKAQKHYHAFSKFARIYKLKKYPYVVTNDLSMNPLDPSHKNTFVLLDKKCKYLFSLNELISIIETAIGNSPEFFCQPLLPLNPYNKQPFTLSTLYNIYFKMKESGRLISILFHFFFLTNFCIYNFIDQYEDYIREIAIKKYVFNSHYMTLCPFVFTMLNSNSHTEKLQIHKDFPKHLLVDIFRPFLYLYFILNYNSPETNKLYNYKRTLNNKLQRFYKYNKAFGRRYVYTIKYFGKIIKTEHKFNTDHISFYGIASSKKHIRTNNNILLDPSTFNNHLSNPR